MAFRLTHHITLVLILLPCALPLDGFAQSASGKMLFMNHCSRCHGVEGAGGEGPALNRMYLPRAANDTLLARVIVNGISGTGMPGNWALGSKDINALIGFVRGLTAQRDKIVSGDAKNGVRLFQESGCLSCHTVGRLGVSVGPDLTAVGFRRGAAFIRAAIAQPGKQKSRDQKGFIEYLVVDVTTADGKAITGVRYNEDTFTIQIKDATNTFYSFRKDEVRSIQRRKEASIMPKVEFSEKELDDLVAFLMQQR